MIRRPERAHELRLASRLDTIEHVDFQPVLHSDERGEKANGAGAGHEHPARLPECAPADGDDLLPRLGDHRGRLEQHAENAQRRVDLHHVLRLDPPALGHESVDLLDATFRVLAVAAHVPLTHGTVRAGHGVGAPHDAHHQITLLQAAPARVGHPTQ